MDYELNMVASQEAYASKISSIHTFELSSISVDEGNLQ